MAIVTLGDLVTGIRGSVGGTTYSANGSGTYLKAWGRGPNRRTLKQVAARQTLSGLRPLWNTLLTAQKEAWYDAAADDTEPHYNTLGASVALTSWQFFCALVARRALVQSPLVLDAPVGSAPVVDPVWTFAASVGAASAPLGYGAFFSTYPGAAVLFVGRNSGVVNWRHINGMALVLALQSPTGTEYNCWSALAAVFPGLVAGERLNWCAVYQNDEGFRGAFVTGTATVGA